MLDGAKRNVFFSSKHSRMHPQQAAAQDSERCECSRDMDVKGCS